MVDTNLRLINPGIKTCPFCGWPGITGLSLYVNKEGKTKKAYSIVCENNKCNASIPGDDRVEARTKWNERA